MSEKVWLTNHLWALESSTDDPARRTYVRRIIALLDGPPEVVEALDWLVTAIENGTLRTSGDLIGKAKAALSEHR